MSVSAGMPRTAAPAASPRTAALGSAPAGVGADQFGSTFEDALAASNRAASGPHAGPDAGKAAAAPERKADGPAAATAPADAAGTAPADSAGASTGDDGAAKGALQPTTMVPMPGASAQPLVPSPATAFAGSFLPAPVQPDAATNDSEAAASVSAKGTPAGATGASAVVPASGSSSAAGAAVPATVNTIAGEAGAVPATSPVPGTAAAALPANTAPANAGTAAAVQAVAAVPAAGLPAVARPAAASNTPAANTADTAAAGGAAVPASAPGAGNAAALAFAALPSASIPAAGTAGTAGTADTAGTAAPVPTGATEAPAVGPAMTMSPLQPQAAVSGATVLPAAQAAAPVATPLLPQVSQPLFSLATAQQGEHVMTLSITPDNLGPVTVRAHVGADGVRIELFAPSEAGREALRTLMTDLRRDLAGSGMNANLSLSAQDAPGEGTERRDRGTEPGAAPQTPANPDRMPEPPAPRTYRPGSPESASTIDFLA